MNAPFIPPTTGAAPQTLVTFLLGRQVFALPIEPIVQIIPVVTITPLPHTDPRVAGVINVRGALVPIINLHYLLNLPRPTLQLYTPILLVRCQERTIGLIVDNVLEVFNPPAKAFIRPKEVLPLELVDAPILAGMVNHPDGTIFVLDIEHILLPHQAEALELATAALLHETGEASPGGSTVDASVVVQPPSDPSDKMPTSVQTDSHPESDAPAPKTASTRKAGASRKSRTEKTSG